MLISARYLIVIGDVLTVDVIWVVKKLGGGIQKHYLANSQSLSPFKKILKIKLLSKYEISS